MGEVAELMRHQPSKPRTNCSLGAICGLCPERRFCPAYCKPKRWRIVTLDEGIEKASLYIDKSWIPARSTISSWITKGAITKPYDRQNLGRAGGVKGIFTSILPIEIAVIAYLKTKEGISIKELSRTKELVESSIKNHQPIRIPGDMHPWKFMSYILLWNYYYFKTKEGYPMEKPAIVTFKEGENEDSLVQVRESIDGINYVEKILKTGEVFTHNLDQFIYKYSKG